MTHKEQRTRRREGVLRIHDLEEKYDKYSRKFWYYFSAAANTTYVIYNSKIPLEDLQLLTYFKNFRTQKERVMLWKNQDFVNMFCQRYLTLNL